jgi:TBC1 domain family protein 5
MRAPDGSYEDGFVAPGGEKTPARTSQPGNLERNNPLSLDDEVRTPFDHSGESVVGILTIFVLGLFQNPWKEWFAAVELRKTIAQDVERT